MTMLVYQDEEPSVTEVESFTGPVVIEFAIPGAVFVRQLTSLFLPQCQNTRRLNISGLLMAGENRWDGIQSKIVAHTDIPS